jgi:RNA polymerase sigma-70 factor, ECF subfamily
MNLAAHSPLASPLVSPTSAGQPISFSDLAAHRSYLVRFAQRRLSDPALAEDAVHDVFEAVITGRASFGGRAALRSWLTAVLKNKIVDMVRRRPLHDSIDDDGGNDEALGQCCPLARPDELAEQREQLQQTLARIDALPESLRDVMRMRVIEERDTSDICAALSISEDNLFVRLHRARKQLLS